MTGQHRGSGEGRLSVLRAVLTSRGLRRGLLIAGFATVAWLAGAASASASADSGNDAEVAASPAPVISPVLESASTSEPSVVAGSARQLDTRPEDSPAVAAGTPSRVLRLAHPITTSLTSRATPAVMAPLSSAARPVAGELDAVTEPVDGTLKRIARPVAADAKPIGAMLSWTRSATAGESIDTVRDRLGADARATHGGPTANVNQDGKASHDGDAVGRAVETAPFTAATHPGSHGIVMPGGASTGNCPNGSPTHDGGTGLLMPAADATVNAGTSRVNPRTAATGLLPDHVEDPAVSPD